MGAQERSLLLFNSGWCVRGSKTRTNLATNCKMMSTRFALIGARGVGLRTLRASVTRAAATPFAHHKRCLCCSASTTTAAEDTNAGEKERASHLYHRHSTRYHKTTREVLNELEVVPNPFTAPKTMGDWAAHYTVRFLRKVSDMYFGPRLVERACMLESIAAVPGITAGMHHHLKSLR